jgi:glutaredoxin
MRLHAEYRVGRTDVQAVVDEVRAEVAVNIPPAFNRFQHSFSHIFAGGYAAGYYSYKWAEVLSADAYAAFEEAATAEFGVLSPEVGRRYRETILEAGGSRSAMENFKAFRGREPRIDALLRHQGMLYTSTACSPCDAGRALLKARGVPFTEKTVTTSDDARILQSREGTNQVPVVRIGSKQIAGYEQGEWTSYLDAAGYPSESALPPTYRHPAATPLAPAAAPKSEPEPEASTLPPPQFNSAPGNPAGNAPPGFRF